jgi:hypothetical protein
MTWAEVAARKLWARLGKPEPPVDVGAACRVLGIELWIVSCGSTLFDAVYTPRTRDGRRLVTVNGLLSRERQRFSVAHELGHALLAGHAARAAGAALDLERSPRRETEANRFAAELLMPKLLLVREPRRLVPPVKELAARYLVSREAMRIRLVQLGLMPSCTDGDTSPPKGAESLGNTDDWDFHS